MAPAVASSEFACGAGDLAGQDKPLIAEVQVRACDTRHHWFCRHSGEVRPVGPMDMSEIASVEDASVEGAAAGEVVTVMKGARLVRELRGATLAAEPVTAHARF